jgi:Peptidase family M48
MVNMGQAYARGGRGSTDSGTQFGVRGLHRARGLATFAATTGRSGQVAMRWLAGLVVAVALSGCVQTIVTPIAQPGPEVAPPPGSPEAAARTFTEVVDRVAPVATQVCLQRTRGQDCNFLIAVDDRPGLPPNAFQTLDDDGRPVLVFTLALIGDARNADELAFVMGHEAAHHIAGHLGRQQTEAITGAIVAGTLASLSGADAASIRAAQDFGAQVGSRRFSKEFELEADALGAEIAWRAGFDPLRGAQFFARLPDPGDRFLGTHPPNSQRYAIVRQTVAQLQ